MDDLTSPGATAAIAAIIVIAFLLFFFAAINAFEPEEETENREPEPEPEPQPNCFLDDLLICWQEKLTDSDKLFLGFTVLTELLLIFGACCELPYGYYQILKFFVCGMSIRYCFAGLPFGLPGTSIRRCVAGLPFYWFWILIPQAIIFNPVLPIRFEDREIWIAFDIAAGIILLICEIIRLRKICLEK